MYIICMILGLFIPGGAISIIIKIIVGATIYFLILIILRDKYVYEVRDIVKRYLKRK